VERCNTDIFKTFIEQQLRYYKETKVHLVVDNAPWHKTKNSQKVLEQIKDLIGVPFLPKCAPKLNAEEYIW
jgi:transposase